MTENNGSLFEVRGLQKWYVTREESLVSKLIGGPDYLKAVDNVNFDIKEGEILGLAGQSGCGKSTLGELLLQLQKPTDGEIQFRGKDITKFGKSEMQRFRQQCQVIFQDPYESLNPRYTIARFVEEPLTIHNIGSSEERDARVFEALEDAGLRPPEKYLDNIPAELSGGERQRVAIARALVLNPSFIVADEPLSMLDVSVRAGLLHLFEELQEKRNLTMLYISHDLSTIKYISDRTMIMYLGNNVEIGPTEEVIHNPAHPYTETLLKAVPQPDPDYSRTGSRLRGEVPDPINLPEGCRFQSQCKYATEECLQSEPDLAQVGNNHKTACYHPINKPEE